MPDQTETKSGARPFRFAFGSAAGKAVWRELMQKCLAELEAAHANGPDGHKLRQALTAIWDGRHLEGYISGMEEGYAAARCLLLLKGDRVGTDIAKIVRRHPNWTTRQICRKLDSLGRKVPHGLSARAGNTRSWENLIADRHSRLNKTIEKMVSRIRIATRRINEAKAQAKVWERFSKRGILPGSDN